MLYCYPAVCLQYTFPYLIPLLSCQVTLFFLILCNERVLFLLFLALSIVIVSVTLQIRALLFHALSRCCFCYSAGKGRYICFSWHYHVVVSVTLHIRALLLLVLSSSCFCYSTRKGCYFYFFWRYLIIVSVLCREGVLLLQYSSWR